MRIESVQAAADLRSWVVARLVELPASLGERRAALLTGSEELAHQLRRHCAVTLGRPGLLLGAGAWRPAGLAFEILARAGRPARHGGERRRQLELLRLFSLFSAPEPPAALAYFDAEALGRPGYVEAFARAIGDLERAGLDPERLAAWVAGEGADGDGAASSPAGQGGGRAPAGHGAPQALEATGRRRLADLAAIWKRVLSAERAATVPCLTDAGALRAAAAVLERDPGVAAPLGPVIAVLVADPTMALLRFLAALPAVRAVFLAARPPRRNTQRWQQQVEIVPWAAARPAAADGGSVGVAAREPLPVEIRRLRRRLFIAGGSVDEGGDAVAGDDLERAAIDLEEYGGIEDEVEATAGWVLEQLAAGIPAEEICIVATDIDAYAPLVTDRLDRLRLPIGNGDAAVAAAAAAGDASRRFPVNILDGVPLATTAAGARILALLHALESGLPVRETIPVLQWLRRAPGAAAPPEPQVRWSVSAIASLIYGAGITGGDLVHPRDAGEWVETLTAFRGKLEIDEREAGGPDTAPSTDDAEPDKRRRVLHAHDRQRWISMIDALLPGLQVLESIAARVRAGAPLAELWAAITDFTATWLRVPPEPPRLAASLLERLALKLEVIIEAPPPTVAGAAVGGRAAIGFLIDQLRVLRLPAKCGAEPGLVLATPAAVRGLEFAAVRVVGLAEGLAPRPPREDPVLPGALRRALETGGGGGRVLIEGLEDRVLAEVHDLFRILASTRRRLALSTPRRWADGSDRGVAGILLEVAMALDRVADAGAGGRASAGATGAAAAAGAVPSAAVLRNRYFTPGVRRRGAARDARPVTPATVLRVVAAACRPRAAPPDWLLPAGGALDLARLRELDAQHDDPATLAAIDGDLSAVWSMAAAPGLDAQQPLSPSRLKQLLCCPYAYLLEQLLGFRKPAAPPPTDRIEPLQFGSLVHLVMERFLEETGARLCRGDGEPAAWRQRAHRQAQRQLERFARFYPLRGAGVVEHERRRLLETVRRFVDYECGLPRRTFVAVEREFGVPAGVLLAVPGGPPLFVRGKIDRVDRLEDGRYSVRDFKTGRVKLLADQEVDFAFDLQIALYARVLERHGVAPSAPPATAGGPAIERDTAAPGVAAAGVAEAVYAHAAESSRSTERRFDGGALEVLGQALDRWLAMSRELLAAGVFPHTPLGEDCRFCAYQPLCGDEAPRAAASTARHPRAPRIVAQYGSFRMGSDHDAAR